LGIFGASGWVASLFLGILDVPAKIVSFAANAPEAREVTENFIWDYQRFEGRFSSDPEAWTERNLVTEDGRQPLDLGEVQLAIEYIGNGRYRGEVNSAHMVKHTFAPWSRLMIDGELNALGNFRGEVWDIVRNQRTPYTRFTLTVDDAAKGLLTLTPWRDDGFFPGEVAMWRTDFEMADGVAGEAFQNTLREITKNHCVGDNESGNTTAKTRYPVTCFGTANDAISDTATSVEQP